MTPDELKTSSHEDAVGRVKKLLDAWNLKDVYKRSSAENMDALCNDIQVLLQHIETVEGELERARLQLRDSRKRTLPNSQLPDDLKGFEND